MGSGFSQGSASNNNMNIKPVSKKQTNKIKDETEHTSIKDMDLRHGFSKGEEYFRLWDYLVAPLLL